MRQVVDNVVVRHTSVANKWKTIHLLLFPGHNATQVRYNITFQTSDESRFNMAFSVAVDTREIPRANTSESARGGSDEKAKDAKPTAPTAEPEVQFVDVPADKRGPKVRKQPAKEEAEVAVEVPALNISLLPTDVQYELHLLQDKLDTGDITVKGYNLTKASLLAPFKDQPQYALRSNAAIPAPQSDGEPPKKPYKDLETEGREGDGGTEKKKDEQKMSQNEQKQEEGKERVKRNEGAAQDPAGEGGGGGVGEEEEEEGKKKAGEVEDEKKKETEPKSQVTFVPVPIVEKPLVSKLLSTLKGSIAKGKVPEAQAQPEAPPPGKDAAQDQGPSIGRKLQHFVNSDRGFLPWERRKYFQDLLEVRRSLAFQLKWVFSMVTFLFTLCPKQV